MHNGLLSHICLNGQETTDMNINHKNISCHAFLPLTPGTGFRQQFWMCHVNSALKEKNLHGGVVPEYFCDFQAIYINIQASTEFQLADDWSSTFYDLLFLATLHFITDTSTDRKDFKITKCWS